MCLYETRKGPLSDRDSPETELQKDTTLQPMVENRFVAQVKSMPKPTTFWQKIQNCCDFAFFRQRYISLAIFETYNVTKVTKVTNAINYTKCMIENVVFAI